MKKAQHIMLLLSKIFGFIDTAVLVIAGIVLIATAKGDATVVSAAISNGVTCFVMASFSLLAAILAIALGPDMESLGDKSKRNGILGIVFGAIGSNVFFILAGIFTLVLRAQQGNKAE